MGIDQPFTRIFISPVFHVMMELVAYTSVHAVDFIGWSKLMRHLIGWERMEQTLPRGFSVPLIRCQAIHHSYLRMAAVLFIGPREMDPPFPRIIPYGMISW